MPRIQLQENVFLLKFIGLQQIFFLAYSRQEVGISTVLLSCCMHAEECVIPEGISQYKNTHKTNLRIILRAKDYKNVTHFEQMAIVAVPANYFKLCYNQNNVTETFFQENEMFCTWYKINSIWYSVWGKWSN